MARLKWDRFVPLRDWRATDLPPPIEWYRRPKTAPVFIPDRGRVERVVQRPVCLCPDLRRDHGAFFCPYRHALKNTSVGPTRPPDVQQFIDHFKHGGYRAYARRYFDWLRTGAAPPGITAPPYVTPAHRDWIERTLRSLL